MRIVKPSMSTIIENYILKIYISLHRNTGDANIRIQEQNVRIKRIVLLIQKYQ